VWNIQEKDLLIHYNDHIGSGGFGDVYNADWIDGLRRTPVAVKLLNQSVFNNAKVLESLRREAVLMMTLRSPHIVTFYGICKGSILILERMNMGSLYSAIGKKLPILSRRNICFQILVDTALGIEYLHEQNCVHADIKSANVLLTECHDSIHAKISDFGMSHIIREDMTSTLIATGVSLRWSAPELLQERPQLTVCADVYSYGVVLWEVMALAPPLPNLPLGALVTRVVTGVRDPMPTNCPPAICNLINDCWALQPTSRPTVTSARQSLSLIFQEEIQGAQSALLPRQQDKVFAIGQRNFNEDDDSLLHLQIQNSILEP
jgi:serine/threonine protein kinase